MLILQVPRNGYIIAACCAASWDPQEMVLRPAYGKFYINWVIKVNNYVKQHFVIY